MDETSLLLTSLSLKSLVKTGSKDQHRASPPSSKDAESRGRADQSQQDQQLSAEFADRQPTLTNVRDEIMEESEKSKGEYYERREYRTAPQNAVSLPQLKLIDVSPRPAVDLG